MCFSYSFIGVARERASVIAGAEVINGARGDPPLSTLFTLPISFKEAEEETEEPLRPSVVRS